MRRVMILLADGLRPDAAVVAAPSLMRLGADYTTATRAATVCPSVTVAALASLATGVGPEGHGLTEPGLGFLTKLRSLRPLPQVLREAGHHTTVVANQMDPGSWSIARSLTIFAGIHSFQLAGRRATDIAQVARAHLAHGRTGLVFAYVTDCDQAGHRYGWMSPEYLAAVARVDEAIAMLADVAQRDTLIILADHGGGGVAPNDHDAPHLFNERIPLVLAGPEVHRGFILDERVSILDVPPTVLYALGLHIPACYQGRPLVRAFREPDRERKAG